MIHLLHEKWNSSFWAGYTVFVVIVVAYLAYAEYFVSAPIIHGDEAGYLLNAAAFAGYESDAYSSYYFGYSLLLIPAYWLSNAPIEIYAVVQAINSFLLAGAGLLTYLLLRRAWPSINGWRIAAVTLAAYSYPAFLGFSALALSENAFIPAVVVIGFLTVALIQQTTLPRALALCCACAFIVIVHPKGLIPVSCGLISYVYATRFRTRSIGIALAVGSGAIGMAVLTKTIGNGYLYGMLSGAEMESYQHYPDIGSLSSTFGTLFTIQGMESYAATLAGHLVYLFTATAGIAYIGVIASAPLILDPEEKSEIRGLCAYACGTAILTLLMSVLFMSTGDRADHLIYGRYVEATLPLLLSITLLLPSSRRGQLLAALCAFGMLAAVVSLKGTVLSGPFVSMNISAIEVFRSEFTGSVDFKVIAIAGTVLFLLVNVSQKFAVRLCATAGAFVFLAVGYGHGYLGPGSSLRSKQHQLATEIKTSFPEQTCINYDASRIQFWERHNYTFFLLPKSLNLSKSGIDFDCGPLTLTTVPPLPAENTKVFAEEYGRELASDQILVVRRQFSSMAGKSISVTNDRLGFNSKNFVSARDLGFGWHEPEVWGTWSQQTAYMSLALPATPSATIRFEIQSLGSSERSESAVSLSCNGKELAKADLTLPADYVIEFPVADAIRNDCINAGDLVLRWHVDNAYSPKQLGINSDTRLLGVGMKSVQIIHP